MAVQLTKVAAIQMTSTDDVAANIETAVRLSVGAIRDGARLVVVPEGFAYLGEANKHAISEFVPGNGPILRRFINLARDSQTEFVLGGFWERIVDSTMVHNTCVHINGEGEVAAVYRKIHLFDVDLPDGTSVRESDSVVPGEGAVTTETRFGRLGLTVCYDLRFPELYRKLVDQGAIAMAVPAAFTLTTGKDHWHVLLRARAIESQSYVIAAAQTGRHFDRRVSYGHALICDPWGCVLSECGEGEGYAIANVDPEVVARVRKQLPSLAHRRM